MSGPAMPSGRGRLPGMGGPITLPPPADHAAPPADHAAPPDPPARTSDPPASAPTARSASRQRRRASSAASTRDISLAPTPPGGEEDAYRPVPYAGEPKVQVNPRIYHGTWRHYEDLVDQLPREQRRGALTALVNAILAQHAPRTPDEARAAISWLRQTEARDPPS